MVTKTWHGSFNDSYINSIAIYDMVDCIFDLAMSKKEGLCYRCGNELGTTDGCYVCYTNNSDEHYDTLRPTNNEGEQ